MENTLAINNVAGLNFANNRNFYACDRAVPEGHHGLFIRGLLFCIVE